MDYKSLKQYIIKRQSLYTAQMKPNEKIPNSKIKLLLELANYAPSHRRTQPWRFVVFEDKAVQSLYEELAKIYSNTTTSESFNNAKVEKLQKRGTEISHAIAICMKRDPNKSVPIHEEEYAVACAVQNILLGMKPLNIIGYWSSPSLCSTKSFKEYLKLGEEDKCLGILQLGVPKDGALNIPQIFNDPIEEKVEWRS